MASKADTHKHESDGSGDQGKTKKHKSAPTGDEELKELPRAHAELTPNIDTAPFYMHEYVNRDVAIRTPLLKIDFTGKSAFQDVKIIETAGFGKTLMLDGKTQSAKFDEFIYHESLVHPALLTHPNPKTVYVGGGGEMATVREILRHKSVEKVVMCDIDKVVCDLSRQYLPEWGEDAWEDPRLELYYDDAKKNLENYKGKFDIIIMDIADPIEAGPGIALYTQEFYKGLKDKLNPGGIFVTQSGPADLLCIEECFTTINRTLVASFDHVFPYTSHVPSFACVWGFNMAFNKHASLPVSVNTIAIEDTDAKVAKRLNFKPGKSLRYYDGQTHLHMTNPPLWLRNKCKEEKRMMTIANPVFMF
jgi:spermidine synthase